MIIYCIWEQDTPEERNEETFPFGKIYSDPRDKKRELVLAKRVFIEELHKEYDSKYQELLDMEDVERFSDNIHIYYRREDTFKESALLVKIKS